MFFFRQVVYIMNLIGQSQIQLVQQAQQEKIQK